MQATQTSRGTITTTERRRHAWFDQLVMDTRDGLARHTRKYANCPDDVQEILQETYLKVFCALNDSGRREHRPKALLYTTSRNVAISRLRHSKVVRDNATVVTVSEELRCPIAGTEQQASARQRLDSLRIAIDALPPKCRKAIVLRLVNGFSQKDIAEDMNIAESTVEKHLAQGLRRCAASLQQENR